MRKTRSELTRARRERLLVKFTRPFEQGSMTGYVLDIGPKFFLLALIGDDGVRFNGFSCLQLADVRNLRVPHRYFEFLEAALKKLGQPFPNKPRVLLGTLPKLLRSASKQFPLVTIHRERVDPDVCFIGCMQEVSRTVLRIQEIGPDAIWDAETETYRPSEITRVDFGGGYEEAPYLVGGKPDRQA